jgi:hypothetical protein
VLALLAERGRLSRRAEELRAEADKIWRAMPAELREVRINYGGRSYQFVKNPDANREDERRQFVDYFRRVCLDQDDADKVSEVLCAQMAKIEAAWESSKLPALRREADNLDARVDKMFDQILETVATTPEGLIAQLRLSRDTGLAEENVVDVIIAGIERLAKSHQ